MEVACDRALKKATQQKKIFVISILSLCDEAGKKKKATQMNGKHLGYECGWGAVR